MVFVFFCFLSRFFSDAVSCMKITFDDRLLVVGSSDGTLIIWMIVNTEGIMFDARFFLEEKHTLIVLSLR